MCFIHCYLCFRILLWLRIPALSLLNSWGNDYKATNYALSRSQPATAQAVNRLPPSIVSLVPTVGLAERQLRGIMSSGSLNDQFVSIREPTSGQLAKQLARHFALACTILVGNSLSPGFVHGQRKNRDQRTKSLQHGGRIGPG